MNTKKGESYYSKVEKEKKTDVNLWISEGFQYMKNNVKENRGEGKGTLSCFFCM